MRCLFFTSLRIQFRPQSRPELPDNSITAPHNNVVDFAAFSGHGRILVSRSGHASVRSGPPRAFVSRVQDTRGRRCGLGSGVMGLVECPHGNRVRQQKVGDHGGTGGCPWQNCRPSVPWRLSGAFRCSLLSSCLPSQPQPFVLPLRLSLFLSRRPFYPASPFLILHFPLPLLMLPPRTPLPSIIPQGGGTV